MDILAHFAATRPGRDEERCSCCRATGEHDDRSECDRCDGSGVMHRGDDAALPWCPGREHDQPAPPKRRHWREPKTAAGPEDYGIGHRPMESGAPLHDLTGEAPGADFDATSYQPTDYLTHRHYHTDSPSEGARDDAEAITQMRRVQGKPDAMVHIYRATHHSAPHEINPGDWVSLSKTYAGKHAYAESINDEPENQYTVHHARVPAKHVRDAGMGGYREQGYWGPPVTCCGHAKTAAIRRVPPEEYSRYQYPDYPARTLPALARYFRKHEPDYYAAVHAHIGEQGVQEAMLVRTKDPRGTPLKRPYVMSGHHRAAAAYEHGQDIPVGDYDNQEDYDASNRSFGHQWWREHHELKESYPDPRYAAMQHEAVLPIPSYGPKPEFHYAPEDWPQEKRMELHERGFEAERQWKAHIKRGLSLGHLTAEQAKGHGYYFGGHETDHNNDPKWAKLPHDLYHVTTDEPSVRAHGLKTRQELSQIRGGHGLGGGEDDTISFAADKAVGHNILRALHEFHGVVNGRHTPAQMWEDAKAGRGADRPFHTDIARSWDSGWKDGDPHPDGLRRALEGTRRWYTGGSDQETIDKAAPGARPAKGDEGWMSGHTPPRRMHAYWEKDMDPDERRENATDFYKKFAMHRQFAGGPEDPMFFATDTKAFAAKDPGHFAMLHVHPKPGAQGYPVSALSEWRTGTGDAVQVHHAEHLESQQQHEGSAGNFAPYSRLKVRTSAWEKTSGQVPAAERTESVAHMLAHYTPTDFDTWNEVRDNFHWHTPKMRAFVDDVRRNGVQRPIPVDYEQDPPQVMNGHTRLLAAERAGVAHVPTRQHEGFMDPDDPDPYGRGPDDPEHWTNRWGHEGARHQAGNPEEYGMGMRPDEEGDPLHDMGSRDWPKDIYDRIHEYDDSYGEHGSKHLSDIRRTRGQPEKKVRIYRAAPAQNPESRNAKKGEINHGDWVTLNRSYAEQEARSVNDTSEQNWKGPNHPERYHIWSTSVPAKHVRSAGNSLMEWGYFGEDRKDLPHNSETCSHRNPFTKRERAPKPWAPSRPFGTAPGYGHYGAADPAYPNPHTGGSEWFHGSQATHEEMGRGFTDPMDMDPGAYEQPEGEDTAHHWNSLLGSHFTADHDIAKDFASGQTRGERPGGFRGIVHARLGLANPKIYASEHDMDHEAYEHEHKAGNHPSAHIPLGSDDEDERYDTEEMWPEASRIHQQYGNHKIPRSAIEGSIGYGRNPHTPRTTWLNTHPDKWGIANRYRDRLQAAGHDGIVYGNEYEVSKHGEKANQAAIVFDPGKIHVTQHHGLYDDCSAQQHTAALAVEAASLGPLYHQTQFAEGFPYDEWSHIGTRAAAEHRAAEVRPEDYGFPGDHPTTMHKVRLHGRVYPHTLSNEQADEVWGAGHTSGLAGDGLPSGAGYHVFPYHDDAEGGDVSYLAHRSAIEHVGTETIPRHQLARMAAWDPFAQNWDEYQESQRPEVPIPSETEEYWHPEHLYHGTSVPLGPGDRAEPGHAPNWEKPLTHAYATPRIRSAQEYAEKAVSQRGGRPRVYEVGHAPDMMPDPESNQQWGGPQVVPHPEWRSKAGFPVLRELPHSEIQPHIAAAFVPRERIFGPTFGLDHRLFTADEQLKPDVRQVLLGRLQTVLEPLLGPAWDMVTRVYLAGSQASRWTSEQLEGNGDLDILIGVAYSYARQEAPALATLTDTGIDKHLNAVLQTRFNAPGWHPPFDPDGTYDLTGHTCPLDITVIKPYAAYDLTNDNWAVKPPDLPDWSPEKFPQGPAIFQEARGLIAQVRAILRLPEPFRSQEAKRIWGYLHEGRNRAFSSEGEGWIGTGNVLEKALDQASGKLIEKLKALNYGVPDHAPSALGHGMTTADLGSADAGS